jgi:hypothetical protein
MEAKQGLALHLLHYDPAVNRIQQANDCSFLAGSRTGLKKEDSKLSLHEEDAFQDQASESSDFFDFHENKPKIK